MSVQAEVEIGKNLTFYFLAKTPATDVIADADAAPAYRIYEEETGTPILTGSMAKLDDAGTLGFYSEQIAATAANGFERGKSYAIHIAAAISAAAIGEAVSFRVTETEAYLDRNAALIESERGAHTWQGNIFYVDPVNGDTHGNGNRGGRDDPYAGVQDCHDNAVVDSNHDVIILVSGAAAGITTLDEAVTISKRYLFIRGPGRDFLWMRSTNGDTISVTADGVELKGFQLETHTVGAGHGIQITDADFLRVTRVWINETRADGINLLRANNCRIEENTFQSAGQGGSGQGIHISGSAGSSDYNVIRKNIISSTAGDGILIEQGTTIHTIIQANTIHDSTGYGINIGASSTDALITDNRLGNNDSGDIINAGAETVEINNEDLTYAIITTGFSGGTGNTSTRIELDANASGTDGAYDPAVITIVLGTGMGQSRAIYEYDGTNKYAYVNRDWKVVPDATSRYVISAQPGGLHVNEGVAQAGGPQNITLNALASAVNETYLGQVIFIVAGTGADQQAIVTAYDGGTKVATVHKAWTTQPDNTSIYAMLPVSGVSPEDVNDQMVDVMETDTHAELGQIAPPATASYKGMLQWLYKRFRNKRTQTATDQDIYNDAGSVVDQTGAITDNGTTATHGEIGSGP